MAALGIIALFVVLGLGVVFVAMQGGPRGARQRLQSQSRTGKRGTTVAVALVIVLFGAAIPTLVLLYNSNEQASAGPAGSNLSAALQEGRESFAEYCATCHSLNDSNSVGKVGPDLDVLRPTAELTINAIDEGRARGMGQMPASLLDGEEAEQVARYVEAVAGR